MSLYPSKLFKAPGDPYKKIRKFQCILYFVFNVYSMKKDLKINLRIINITLS